MKLARSLTIWVLLLAALAPAGAAAAETRTFLNTDDLFPTGGALTVGPASKYPSTIAVSGVAGTVTKATVTVVGLASASGDDIDMAINGPNGQTVMLMSDACGLATGLSNDDYVFDDSAPVFLSDVGGCPNPFKTATVMPSNYGDPAEDDLSPNGGPAAPYLNKLSFLAGGSPNGAWNLFVRDDNQDFNGFDVKAWALTLEIEPPPPPPPTIVTVTVPGPPAPSASASPPAGRSTTQAKTGQRAAALAKCKTKKSPKARARCRAKAQKLPV